MQNTGTWNSDLAIFFFFCLLAPISAYFLRAVLDVIAESKPAPAPSPRPAPRPARRDTLKPMSINVSLNFPNFKGRTASTTPKSSRIKKKKTPKTKKSNPKPSTDSNIVNEAVSALVGLGYKKGEAVKVVKSITAKKVYNSAESLVNDCFVCIS